MNISNNFSIDKLDNLEFLNNIPNEPTMLVSNCIEYNQSLISKSQAQDFLIIIMILAFILFFYKDRIIEFVNKIKNKMTQ